MGRLRNSLTQRYKLHAHDKMPNDHFGRSVSLYGDTALIGATGDAAAAGLALFLTSLDLRDAAVFTRSLYGDTALIGATGRLKNTVYGTV